jgi:Zn-finger protein
VYTLNLAHSSENEKVWESADCVYPHAGHGQETLQDSNLPVPGASDSIEMNNDNETILAYSENPAN